MEDREKQNRSGREVTTTTGTDKEIRERWG